jgi:hypothetical protein
MITKKDVSINNFFVKIEGNDRVVGQKMPNLSDSRAYFKTSTREHVQECAIMHLDHFQTIKDFSITFDRPASVYLGTHSVINAAAKIVDIRGKACKVFLMTPERGIGKPSADANAVSVDEAGVHIGRENSPQPSPLAPTAIDLAFARDPSFGSSATGRSDHHMLLNPTYKKIMAHFAAAMPDTIPTFMAMNAHVDALRTKNVESFNECMRNLEESVPLPRIVTLARTGLLQRSIFDNFISKMQRFGDELARLNAEEEAEASAAASAAAHESAKHHPDDDNDDVSAAGESPDHG